MVMPLEQPVGGEGCGVVLGGVGVDGDYAVDLGCRMAGGVDVEPSGYGRADLLGVEDFALNGAGADDVVGEDGEGGVLLYVESERCHAA